MFCLPKNLATEFKNRLKSGEISPEKLTEMTTSERRTFFSSFLGENNAKQINAAFEGKLLLKNQQQGIITWAKSVSGMKPEVKRSLIDRVEKMTNILQPKEMDSFLGDLVEKRLGIDVTMEEATKIADLSKHISDTKKVMEEGGDRLAYGKAKVDFYNYTNGLKNEAEKKGVLQRIIHPLDTAVEVAGLSKSLNASMDNSSIFRQGWKTLLTHPRTWLPNAADTFLNMARTIGGKEVMNVVNADILSRPNYSLMQKAKLAVGTAEESFPTSLPEKIPVLGRLYKASESAFTAFIHRTRADVFDKYIEIAKKSGVDLNDKLQIESIGKLVNSLTGRGNLGKIEPVAGVINNAFFSPRSVKAHIDTLTLHSMDKMSWFARKQASINLLKIVTATAGILALADTVSPGSVEWDPRSADFGKIKIGNTRFDVTGGMGSLVTLAARLITKSSKSSTTGIVTPLDSDKFGSMTSGDIVANFFSNKLSPAYSVIKDLVSQKTFEGEKPTIGGELKKLFTPLPVSNYLKTKDDPEAANPLLILIADGLGISANTYSRKPSEAETKFEEFKALPPEQAKAEALKLKESNPTMYAKVKKVGEDSKLGITPKDQYVRGLGIENGERAGYLWDEMKDLSAEEKKAYVKEMVTKKIIPVDTKKVNGQEVQSSPVLDQIKKLKEGGGDLKQKAKEANSPKSMADIAKLYVKAFSVDPASAIQTLFTSEQLKAVKGDAVIMERMGIDQSSAVKKKGGAGATDKLDHTVPLELGGDNSESNLKIVTEEEWKSYTSMENYLGKLLANDKISENEAKQTIKAFKNKELTSEEIRSKFK